MLAKQTKEKLGLLREQTTSKANKLNNRVNRGFPLPNEGLFILSQ